MRAPGRHVLEGYGVAGPVEPLDGGQGGTWATESVVLKPAESVEATDWLAEVMSSIEEDGFRVPRPLRSRTGGWVVDGWAAWERVQGEHRTEDTDWPAALEVAIRFDRATAGIPRPDWAAGRDHVFAQADRMAWEELPLPDGGPLGPLLRRLGDLRRPVTGEPSLAHADLAGNLLWHDDLPPAVIDLSPMWRPGGLGAAQVVVDSVLWYSADSSLGDRLLEVEPQARQVVLRALISRLAVDAQMAEGATGVNWDEDLLAWDLEHAEPLAAWVAG